MERATALTWKSAEIVLDSSRADEVFLELLDCWHQGAFPFADAHARLPQTDANMPSSLVLRSRDHAMFLFCLCLYMRSGINASHAGMALGRLYEQDSRWFDPFWARGQPTNILREALTAVGLGSFKNGVPRFWIENCRRLVDRFNGDPRLIFSEVTSFEEACSRVANQHRRGIDLGFQGFQMKMTSMLLYFLTTAGLLTVPFAFPNPLDVHVFRILMSHRILEVRGIPQASSWYNEPVKKKVAAFMLDFCKRHGVDSNDLANVLWLCSRELCSAAPGNRARIVRKGGPLSSVIIHDPVRWTPATRAAHERTCGACPIAKTCELNFPTAFYYVGNTLPRGKRVEPPSAVT